MSPEALKEAWIPVLLAEPSNILVKGSSQAQLVEGQRP